MGELPLLRIGNDPRFNRRSGLAETIRSIDVDELQAAYWRTVEAAPRRVLHKERFFVGHDGGGGVANVEGEKVRAKAIFNSNSPLVDEDGHEPWNPDCAMPGPTPTRQRPTWRCGR